MKQKTLNLFWKQIKTKNGGTFGEHKRFIVSITNKKYKTETLTLKRFDNNIRKLNNLAQDLNLKSYCFGFWNEKQLCYIDLNISIDNLKTALNVGGVFNQIAIYDTKLNKEIRL